MKISGVLDSQLSMKYAFCSHPYRTKRQWHGFTVPNDFNDCTDKQVLSNQALIFDHSQRIIIDLHVHRFVLAMILN